jgi:hypothetical protein
MSWAISNIARMKAVDLANSPPSSTRMREGLNPCRRKIVTKFTTKDTGGRLFRQGIRHSFLDVASIKVRAAIKPRFDLTE